MKANHQTNVVKLGEPRIHTNADTLELFDIGGYQVVTKKGQFKAGDLAVYVQPDSVVPQTEPFKFIWGPYAESTQNILDSIGSKGTPIVSESRRRITVRKFRKEWSEGLLLPVTDFYVLYAEIGQLYPGITEGTDVSELLGVTHYDPDKGVEGTKGENSNGPRRRRPTTLKGWFFYLLHKLGFDQIKTEEMSLSVPVYDVAAYKNYVNAFTPGESVTITEKIHGSNARYVFFDGHMYAGSRTLWKSEKSNCVWRKALEQNPWIEEWCRAHEGYTLYGEVVPTQKGFDYGCKPGEVKFFAFDIRTPEGEWKKPSIDEFAIAQFRNGQRMVPYVALVNFDIDRIKADFVDGPSFVAGAKHIREGIVIAPNTERHVTGLGRLQLKLVSNAFLEKDSK